MTMKKTVMKNKVDLNLKSYAGAGNRFIIADNRKGGISDYKNTVLEMTSEDSEKFYDGVIFVEDSDIADFHMNYFNRDGTGNALCGNGLRCTMRYLLDNKISGKKIILLEAVGKIYKGILNDDGRISVQFYLPAKIRLNFSLKVNFDEWWQMLNMSFIDVGSPHIVIFIDDIKSPEVKSLDDIKIIEWGRNVRMHKDLMPEGANVNFVKIEPGENSVLSIRSYERGVEGETLSCGTGALSAAVAAYFVKKIKPPFRFNTRSGSVLEVNFKVVEGKIRDFTLTGEAAQLKI